MLSVPLVERATLVGVLQVVDSENGAFTTEDERIAETLAAQCVVFIQRERMSRSLAQAEKLDREIKLAREIQMSTLPSEMPRLAEYDMAGQFCPADQTGGDTFDLVPLDEQRLFLLLGDASGHGIGPALSATQMTGMLRVALRLGADLDAIFAQVNNQLVEDLPEEHFVTAFFGVLDVVTHTVRVPRRGPGPAAAFPGGHRRLPLAVADHVSAGIHEVPADRSAAADRARAGRHPGPDHGRRVRDRKPGRARCSAPRASSRCCARATRLDVRPAGAGAAGRARVCGRASAGATTSRSCCWRGAARPRAAPRCSGISRAVSIRSTAIFRFVGDFLAARSLDAELHMPVCFIIEELFTNFVKYNTEGTHDISLSLGHTPEQLTVRITDFDVESFDVTSAPAVDVDKPLAERQPGGLGLHLVRQMADTLQYEYVERRSTITFTKALEAG